MALAIERHLCPYSQQNRNFHKRLLSFVSQPCYPCSRTLHYILHTFALSDPLPHVVVSFLELNCELRDLMQALDVIEVGLCILLAANRRFLQFHSKPIRGRGGRHTRLRSRNCHSAAACRSQSRYTRLASRLSPVLILLRG